MLKVNKERLIKTFIDMAKIPSPSWHEERMMHYIIKSLEKFGAEITKYPCGSSYNLLARIPGTLNKKPLLLSAHMDTVVPCEKVIPIETDRRITSDGTSILGADDKSAIAMFLEALEVLHETKTDHGPIEVLISCAEELGLIGIKQFDMSVLKSRTAFVFDSRGSVGKIIMKAPYHSSMELFVKGKAAHAGMEPENGISAIQVLAKIIARLPDGRIDKETTTNVGIISGGKATNIVAPEAYCKLEVRSINKTRLKEIETQIRTIAREVAEKNNAKVTIKRYLEYPGFTLKENDRIVRLTRKALESIGIEPSLEISGGGSDTNIFNRSGIKAINLSCGMQKVHTTDEYITKKDLVDGARLTLAIIQGV